MRNQRRVIFFAGLIVVLALFAALGYRYWYQPTFDFFNTDDAMVTGSLVHIAAPAAGQVTDMFVDVGSAVKRDDLVGTIKVLAGVPVASAAAAGPSVPQVLARVTSPVSGTVATRDVSTGDTVNTGQSIATVVDLNQLWVVVNVDESRAAEIQLGQAADVAISDVNHTFRGRVVDAGTATSQVTAAPSLSLTGTSSNTDVIQKVPVKITFDYTGFRLLPGMSTSVTIYTHGAPS